MVTSEQVHLFRRIFVGRLDVYGTYDPASGRVWQVKEAVSDDVVRAHLDGRKPLGLYLLKDDTLWASVCREPGV